MSEQEIGMLIVTLGVFLGAVHALGYLFERLRQPRLVGEIAAGILLGPYVLGAAAPEAASFLFAHPSVSADHMKTVLNFVYWLGLLLLMFLSGSQVRGLLAKDNCRETAWLLGVGTPLPFFLVLALGATAIIPLAPLTGSKGSQSAALLVLAAAVAVTSIPVISRIFSDLGILHTRFASLILGSAVLEDIALWGVAAVATALTQVDGSTADLGLGGTAAHVATSLAYAALAITVMPWVQRRLRTQRINLVYKASPLAYAVLVLFAYVGGAAALGVNLVFAAFLAGFGLAGGVRGDERAHFAESLEAIRRFSYGVFIPIYFALVGYRLVLGREFSATMLLIFFVGSSLLALASVALAAKLAGFNRLDAVNLAVTTNARGGPGIVLASVAFDAGIINGAFYTTLVLTAIFTSQLAAMWLSFVLSRGWPLLSTDLDEVAARVASKPRPSPGPSVIDWKKNPAENYG